MSTIETIKIEISQHYIDQRELGYEDHRRGTNYIATVQFAPSQPGGLSREFWAKGSGSFRAVPDNLEIGDFIEVAHDYTSGCGNRSRKRDYYRIVSVSEGELEFTEDFAPKSKSISKSDFAAMLAGEERIAPSIDLSGVTDDELISELERRGHKLNFIV